MNDPKMLNHRFPPTPRQVVFVHETNDLNDGHIEIDVLIAWLQEGKAAGATNLEIDAGDDWHNRCTFTLNRWESEEEAITRVATEKAMQAEAAPTAPVVHNITSTSTNDAAAGTGARTVKVFGLDSSWRLQDEVVTIPRLRRGRQVQQVEEIDEEVDVPPQETWACDKCSAIFSINDSNCPKCGYVNLPF